MPQKIISHREQVQALDPWRPALRIGTALDDHLDVLEALRLFGCAHIHGGRRLHHHHHGAASWATQQSRLADPAGWKIHPVTFQPAGFLGQGARDYTSRLGIPSPQNIDYSKIARTADSVKGAGRFYDQMKDYDPSATPYWDAMAKQVNQQYDHAVNRMGITPEFVDYDPYKNAGDMVNDVTNNHRLKVLSTAATGAHPYFDNDTNDRFRFVHDLFGHAATGRGFDRHGEQAAYLAHRQMFTPQARPALATETLGQNSSLILNGQFAPQKIGVLPQNFWGGTADDMMHNANIQVLAEQHPTDPVNLRTSWRGVGEDANWAGTQGTWPDEKEVTLLPGADTPIDQIDVQRGTTPHPRRLTPSGPIQVTARQNTHHLATPATFVPDTNEMTLKELLDAGASTQTVHDWLAAHPDVDAALKDPDDPAHQSLKNQLGQKLQPHLDGPDYQALRNTNFGAAPASSDELLSTVDWGDNQPAENAIPTWATNSSAGKAAFGDNAATEYPAFKQWYQDHKGAGGKLSVTQALDLWSKADSVKDAYVNDFVSGSGVFDTENPKDPPLPSSGTDATPATSGSPEKDLWGAIEQKFPDLGFSVGDVGYNTGGQDFEYDKDYLNWKEQIPDQVAKQWVDDPKAAADSFDDYLVNTNWSPPTPSPTSLPESASGTNSRDLWSPLFGEQGRPTTPEGKYYYSPHDLNPPSNSVARPTIRPDENDFEEDQVLPGMPTTDRSVHMYRGEPIDLTLPGAADIRHLLYGEDIDAFAKDRTDPELFPRSSMPDHEHGEIGRHRPWQAPPGPPREGLPPAEWANNWLKTYEPDDYAVAEENNELWTDDKIADFGKDSPIVKDWQQGHTITDPFDHPELGQKLLDFWEKNRNNGKGGLGRHWSLSPEKATDFAGTNEIKRFLPTRFVAEQPVVGQRVPGEDPYRTNTGGDYSEEKEITQVPGSPMNIVDVQVLPPGTDDWRSVWPQGRSQTRHSRVLSRAEHDVAVRALRMAARITARLHQAVLGDDEWNAHVQQVHQALANVPGSMFTNVAFAGPQQGYTPQRYAQQQKLIQQAWNEFGADVPRNKQGMIVGGLPGAGKSTVLNNVDIPGVGAVNDNFLRIDPDWFKQKMAETGMVPQVEGLTPMEAAPLIHQESSDMARRLAKMAYKHGTNIAWDGTLRRPDSATDRFAEFQKYGYNTPHGVFVDVPIEDSVSRAQNRWRKKYDGFLSGQNTIGGRVVPEDFIRGSASPDPSFWSQNRINFENSRPQFATAQVFDGTQNPAQLIADPAQHVARRLRCDKIGGVRHTGLSLLAADTRDEQTVEALTDLFCDGTLSYEQLRTALRALRLDPDLPAKEPTSLNDVYLDADAALTSTANSGEWLDVLHSMGLVTNEQIKDLWDDIQHAKRNV